MKKYILITGYCLCASLLCAHTPLMTIEDNGDGTIYIEGGFSNGATAEGVLLFLTDKNTGEKIWDGSFPATSSINLPIPKVPYTVTFDGGPGHVIVKDGPRGEQGSASVSPPQVKAVQTPKTGNVPGSPWTSVDSISALPSVGPSFTAMIACLLSVINLILLYLLFRRVKKGGL